MLQKQKITKLQKLNRSLNEPRRQLWSFKDKAAKTRKYLITAEMGKAVTISMAGQCV